MFDSYKFDGADNPGSADNEKSSSRGPHTVTTEVSDDDDKSECDAKESPSTHVSHASSSVEKSGEQLGHSPRRTFVSVMTGIFRRASESSSQDTSDPPSRKHSQTVEPSRARGVATALGLFQSHNPDVDSEEAAAPIPRKSSVVSNHSGEMEPDSLSEPTFRRPSYMPKNATASFLKTANGNSETTVEDKEKLEAERAAAARKPSVVGSVMGVGNGGDAMTAGPQPSGRRPSGLVPNNIASRYSRSAGFAYEDDPNYRRRSYGRRATDAQIKAVAMQADQFQQWQNSVQRNGNNRFSNPPPTVRQPSVDNVIEEVEGESDRVGTRQIESGKVRGVAISVQPATPERDASTPHLSEVGRPMKQNKPMSAFLPDPLETAGASKFGAEVNHDLDDLVELDSRPETPLESLGFQGAVPA